MSLMNIALSGLNVAQIGLATTGNNISNVNTTGYNRQITRISESLVANGAKVTSVDRQFNAYVASQLNKASSEVSGLNTYASQISQIDSLLGDKDISLNTVISKFFSSLSNLSAEPADTAARQGVIGTANNMVTQFNALDGYLKSMYKSVDSDIENSISKVNSLGSQIALMNKEISITRAKTGEEPNALLDERDRLVSELSSLININVTVQENGSYNVSVGNGLALVAGQNKFDLLAVASSEDPTRLTVGHRDSNGNITQIRESFIKSGSIGGAIKFRNEALTSAQNRLGQVAISMAMAFNDTHEAGFDLTGATGNPFFTESSPVAYSNDKNTSPAVISGSFTNYSDITVSDYDITYTAATGYTVNRKDTNETVATFAPGSTTLAFGGMTLNVSSTPNDGDKFLVRPLITAAQTLKNVITDVGKVSAASIAGADGNNKNVLEMMKLQTASLVGGKSTFSQGYAAMVTDVGNRTSVIKVNLTTQVALQGQLDKLNSSESGVNLDEEAANLLMFQQYYQANAKVIDTSSTIMDTILGLRG